MSVIWTLKRRAERRREKMNLPPIEDENDLPDPQDIPGYVHVRLICLSLRFASPLRLPPPL